VARNAHGGLLDAVGPDRIGRSQTGTGWLQPEGRTHAYVIHDAPPMAATITVTAGRYPRDPACEIGALMQARRLLMDTLRVDKVDRVVLAGAFARISAPITRDGAGMIPDAPLRRCHSRQRGGRARAGRCVRARHARRIE